MNPFLRGIVGVGAPLAVLFGATAAANPPDAAAVIECMRANLPRAIRIQTFEVTAYDREGNKRVLKGRVFGTREKDRTRITARIEQPRDLAGAAFLVREGESSDEMYVYLPSTNRVKRLGGAATGGRLWGTDFSYDEFKQVFGAFDGGQVELSGSAETGARPSHVLKLAPKVDGPNVYDAIQLQVDQQTCVVLAADFLRKGQVQKRLTAPGEVLQSGRGWYPSEILLEDLVEGTKTHLRVTGVTESQELAAKYFHPQQFYTAR